MDAELQGRVAYLLLVEMPEFASFCLWTVCDKYRIAYADPGDRNDIRELWRAVQSPA